MSPANDYSIYYSSKLKLNGGGYQQYQLNQAMRNWIDRVQLRSDQDMKLKPSILAEYGPSAEATVRSKRAK